MKRRVYFSVVLLAWLLVGLLWYRSFANPLRYPVQGIDVSRHQGDIDWTLLASAEIDFAYIKATEGGDWVDPKFAQNWPGAKRVGIARGGYHYFSTCRPGGLQADNFLNVLNVMGASPDALPAALDLEYGGFCGAPPDKETLLAEAKIWIDRVETATGKPVIIYTTRDFHAAFLKGEFENQPFWLRSIGRPPFYFGRKTGAFGSGITQALCRASKVPLTEMLFTARRNSLRLLNKNSLLGICVSSLRRL